MERFEPGRLFRLFMIVYFTWRFFIEFIRVNPVAAYGLTYYQIAAAGVVLLYASRWYLGSMGSASTSSRPCHEKSCPT